MATCRLLFLTTVMSKVSLPIIETQMKARPERDTLAVVRAEGLRLEQERIPWPYVVAHLEAL